MVCRDATTHKASKVHPLKITTQEERDLYSIGKAIKDKRQSFALKSLSRVPPSSEEAETLHSFYLEYGQHNDIEGDRVWMEDTRLENCLLMFPQERKSVPHLLTILETLKVFSVHQKIFGGELAPR
jgi:acyl-coenzyme A thioesterase 9